MIKEFPEHDNKNWAIAIVHGLGTPNLGGTTKRVCEGIGDVCTDFKPAGAAAVDNQAAAYTQNWTFGGSKARVAEVFWGDLSLVRGSYRDLVLALCTNLYGVVHVHSRILQKADKVVRWLPIIPFYLVRWIVLPAHLVALAIAVPIYFSGSTVKGSRLPDGYMTSNDPLFLGIAAIWVVVGLAVMLRLRRPPSRRIRPQPWDVAAIFTAFVALSAFCATKPVANWFQWCVDTHGKEEVGTWKILKGVVGRQLPFQDGVCKVIVSNTPINDTAVHGVGRYIAVNELIGDIAFFITAGMVLIYLGIALWTWARGRRETAGAMFFVATVCVLFVVIVAIVLQAIDWITRAIQFSGSEKFQAYWYELGLGIWLLVVAAGAGAAYLRRKRAVPGPAGDPSSPTTDPKVIYARLIVSNVFQFTVLAATFVFILVFLSISDLRIEGIYSRYVPYGVLPLLILAILAPIVILFEPLRDGLDLAMDVVNHFVQENGAFPVRHSISQRFYRTIEELTQGDARPHVLVMAHSQGTVIAVDALVNGIWDAPLGKDNRPLRERVATMTLLTFGSPLTHIYEHYFPEDYQLASAPALRRLAEEPRVKWLNVYRIDDPVGTIITGPNRDFPTNIGAAEGGHRTYWGKDVLGAPDVRRCLPGGV